MRMKFDFEKKHLWQDFQKNNSKLDRILIYIIASLAAIIILATVVTAITRKIMSGKELMINDPLPTEIESLNKKNGEEMAAFTGLPTIRCTTLSDEENNSNETSSILVLSPWFSYPQEDTQFFEELSRKRVLINSIITFYFSSKTKNEILAMDEKAIKDDLTQQINSQLSLGKINQLFFTEFIFFE